MVLTGRKIELWFSAPMGAFGSSKVLTIESHALQRFLSYRYQHLLSDIHYCYFTQRELLLTPSVTSAMADLVSVNKKVSIKYYAFKVSIEYCRAA